MRHHHPVLTLLLLSAVPLACVRNGTDTYRTVSPNQTYTATITGSFDAPRSMFVQHSVTAEIASNAHTGTVRRIELYRFDSMDKAFSRRYATPDWVRDNVLRFRSLKASPSTNGAQVILKNRTADPIKWIRITAEDLFVVLDLPSGVEIALRASPHPTSELLFLDVEWWSSEKGRSRYRSADFPLADPIMASSATPVFAFENDGCTLALKNSK